jgi:heat shock protein HspQ
MDNTKDIYMFYHQLMNIDDVYIQQEYLLNEQLYYDKRRSDPKHPTEGNR